MGKELKGKIKLGSDNPTVQAANELPAKIRKGADTKPAGKHVTKRGRPAKPPEELRSERMSVALTKQEVQDLKAISAATGEGTSRLICIAIQRLIASKDMDDIRRKAADIENNKVTI